MEPAGHEILQKGRSAVEARDLKIIFEASSAVRPEAEI
jgi:hypothetical protein